MIVTEFYRVKLPEHIRLVRTYSNEGWKIERNGILYDDAVDPEDADRVYVETDQRVDGLEE